MNIGICFINLTLLIPVNILVWHKNFVASSCCSLVDREPSHTAYVFAAGFDKSNNIFLGVRKPAICLYLRHRIILSHVTALKGRLLPNDNVVEHISIH